MHDKKRRVLITTSPYTTLLYFLISSLQGIKDTTYFFFRKRKWEAEEKKNTKDKLPDSFFFNEPSTKSRFRKFKLFQRIYIIIQLFVKYTTSYFIMYFLRNLRWPFLKSAEIFAYDGHPMTSALLARGRKYTFIEEGLDTYDADKFAYIRSQSLGFRLCAFLTFPLGPGKLGTSGNATKIILTGLAEIPKCYSTKNTEIVSMPELWEKSSDEKRAFIMDFFNLTSKDLEALRQRDIIYLDQPLARDQIMTDKEQIEMMRKVFRHYGASRVLLKTHYRNPLKYDGLFPGVLIWDKLTPMELLSLCGVKFTRAVTVNSTAVLSFPDSVRIDWLGADVNSPFFSHFSETTKRVFYEDFIRGKVLPDRIKSQLDIKEA